MESSEPTASAAAATTAPESTAAPVSTGDAPKPSSPVAVVCIGMAGSGKTTFMRRINAHLHAKDDPPYVINLDPAVLNVPFESNIDIRDAVNYEEVMRQYNLGPNGGILTSLNLFATKVDQVIGLLEKRAQPDAEKTPLQHILIDTPGQIEVFVWSASGTILLESLASSFPTVIAYVIDTPRTTSTSTFVSNMLYACSILYKTRLPMILVFNKTDVQDASFAKEWMTDYDAFKDAHMQDQSTTGGGGGDDGIGQGGTYMGSLVDSMGMMLQEFYAHLSVVGVSSRLGTGVDEFFAAVQEKADEFRRDYQPELEKRKADRDGRRKQAREKELDRLMKGMSVTAEGAAAAGVVRGGGRLAGEESSDDPDSGSDVEDPGDMPDALRDDDGGLQARYEDALGNESLQADASFAKYLRSQGGDS